MSARALAPAFTLLLTLGALLAPLTALAVDDGEGGPPSEHPDVTPPDDVPSSPAPCPLLLAPSQGRGRATGIAIWHPDVILRAGAPLNSLAAGDFVRERPGDETVAADASGGLWLAWRENNTWLSEVAWSAGGNLTSLAPGELDGRSEGPELACGVALANGTGSVFVVSFSGGRASARQVQSTTAPVLAVGAGDVDTGVAGTEVVALDGGGNLSVAFPESPGQDPRNILRLPGASCLLVDDIDTASPGDEVVAGTSTGEVVELYRDGLGWQERGLWVSPAGISALASGEADPLHEGPELALSTVSGEVTVLERLGDAWSGRTVWSSGGTVSALATGDADADTPGSELLAACPDNITRLRWDGKAWDRAPLWASSGPSSAMTVAEVDADHAGNEVLVAGRNGNLTALGLYHPGFSMAASPARLNLTSGESAAFGLVFTPDDKLGGNLTVTTGTLPGGVSVVSGTGTVALTPPNTTLTLVLAVNASVANGEYRFLVTASHAAGLFDSVWLSLSLDRKLDFSVALATSEPEVSPGATAVYTVTVRNLGTVNDGYRLNASVEGGWAVQFPAGNSTGRMAPGEKWALELWVKVPGDAGGKSARLTVNVSSAADLGVNRSASMRIVVTKDGGPCALILLPAGLVGTAFLLGRKGNKREEKIKKDSGLADYSVSQDSAQSLFATTWIAIIPTPPAAAPGMRQEASKAPSPVVPALPSQSL